MALRSGGAKQTIECAENGPYIVKYLDTFTNSKGERIESKKTMALCRCGGSKKKPFCDGAHARIGFKGDKLPGRAPDHRDTYLGQEITIHDNRGICSHAGFCTSGLPAVWRMGVEPWIDPDGAGVEAIIATIAKCPSGALGYSLKGVEHRDRDRQPGIQVSKDGPYDVTGPVELIGVSKGEGATVERYALCRCGGSKNKPFCDGTHWSIDFKDDEHLTGQQAKTDSETELQWYRVADLDELVEGRVKTVVAGVKSIALTHSKGQYGALDNRCPHQGGPLGQGTLENGVLRCPWHGWDFDPLHGRSVDGNADGVAAYRCEIRRDGVYVAAPGPAKHIRTVSDVMVETMVNWGVRHVFGIVGHSNLGMADALRRQEDAGNLTYIGVRHEGAAAFACSGYAKLSGRPAACFAIAGPGATNLLTGLWDAKMDRAPVLAMTGQVDTQVLGPGAFQEIDQTSTFEAVATWSQTVLHDSNHAELMTLALKHATVQRDVSHLIFPNEIQTLRAGDGVLPSGPEGRIGTAGISPPADSVTQAVERMARAKRPLIIVGYGTRDDMASVLGLAERLNAPVVTTFKAKGQIRDDHPLAGGVLGRSGTPIASWLMKESDLLIVFGASFSNHTGIDGSKDIIQVDLERMALGKFHPVQIAVWGDVGVVAKLFSGELPDGLDIMDRRPQLAERWRLWREEKQRRTEEDRGKGINSASIFMALTRQAPENAVIAVDVGNNTYSFGRYFECKKQSILMSGYLGSIGFGFPAAMGAWAAAGGERPILSVSGDGGFGQYLAEFTTAVKYGMNITHILLNNSEFGKISLEQRTGEWPVWETSLHNPNFAEFAKLCGGYGVRVTEATDLDQAMKAAISHEGPALVEVMSDVALV